MFYVLFYGRQGSYTALRPCKATFLAAGSAGLLSDAVSNTKKHTNLGLINFEVVLRSVFTFCFLEVTA